MAELIGQTVLFAGSKNMEGWVDSGKTLKTTNGKTIRYLTKTGTSPLYNDCFVGQIMLFPTWGLLIPERWALCNGASMNNSQYPLLSEVIGKQFGGGGMTFNLPNIANLGNLKYIICIEGIFPI